MKQRRFEFIKIHLDLILVVELKLAEHFNFYVTIK